MEECVNERVNERNFFLGGFVISLLSLSLSLLPSITALFGTRFTPVVEGNGDVQGKDNDDINADEDDLAVVLGDLGYVGDIGGLFGNVIVCLCSGCNGCICFKLATIVVTDEFDVLKDQVVVIFSRFSNDMME